MFKLLTIRCSSKWLALLLAFFVSSASAAPVATLNILPLMDGYYPTAEAVLNDGTVAGWGVGGSTGIGWKWSVADGAVTIPRISLGYDISADGQWIAGQQVNDLMLWSEATGKLSLTPGLQSGSARGISADASVVVGIAGDTAFRWTEATGLVDLGDLAGGTEQSFALDVSADGNVVAGRGTSASGTEAFRWTTGTGIQGLGDLPGGTFSSSAAAISGDGTVIVGNSNSALGIEAFRWSGGTMTGLGVFDGTFTESAADTVNEDGSLIGGYVRNGSDRRAMIWDAEHGMRLLQDVLVNEHNLDLQDFTTLREVWGMSPDGQQLVGYGSTPSGQATFLIFLPQAEDSEIGNSAIPEPSMLALCGCLTLFLSRLRSRQNAISK